MTIKSEENNFLVEGCKKGDRNAQHALYRFYSTQVFNTLLRMTGKRDDAEDLLQETFIDVFGGLKKFRGDAKLSTWIQRIAINKAAALLRKKSIDLVALKNIESVQEAEKEILFFSISHDQLQKEIFHLPDGARSVLTMFVFEGMSHIEIGNILGITESTSKSQLFRAKKLLKEKLEKYAKN